MNKPVKRKSIEIIILSISLFLFIYSVRTFYLFLGEMTELSGVSYYIDVFRGIAFTGSKFNLIPVLTLLILPIINIIISFIWISALLTLIKDPFERFDRRRLIIFIFILLLNVISHYSFGMAVIGMVN